MSDILITTPIWDEFQILIRNVLDCLHEVDNMQDRVEDLRNSFGRNKFLDFFQFMTGMREKVGVQKLLSDISIIIFSFPVKDNQLNEKTLKKKLSKILDKPDNLLSSKTKSNTPMEISCHKSFFVGGDYTPIVDDPRKDIELENHKEQIKKLKEKNKILKEENKILKEEKSKSELLVSTSKIEPEANQGKSCSDVHELHKMEDKYKELFAQCGLLQREIEERKYSFDELNKIFEAAKRDNHRLELQNDAFRSQLEDMRKENKDKLDYMSTENDKLRNDKEQRDMASKLLALRFDYDEMKLDYESMEEILRKEVDKSRKLDKEVANLSGDNKTLEAEVMLLNEKLSVREENTIGHDNTRESRH